MHPWSVVLCDCYTNYSLPMVLPWFLHGDSRFLPCELYHTPIRLPCDPREYPVGFPWTYHGTTMECPRIFLDVFRWAMEFPEDPLPRESYGSPMEVP